MKKPKAIVVSKDSEERQRIANSLKNGISKDTGIDFKVNQYENRQNLTKEAKEAQLYVATSLNPYSSQQKLARKMKKRGSHCARLLVTNTSDIVKQDIEHSRGTLLSRLKGLIKKGSKPAGTLLTMYFLHKGDKISSENIDWKDFKNWFRNTSPFHDIVIEGDKHPLDTETKKAIEYVRQKRKMCQPLSVGVVGLGKLGRQILHDFKSKPYIESVHAFSEFANDNYEEVIVPRMAFEGDQRRNFHFHKALEELIEANPDLFIISTGEFGVPYEKYNKIGNLTERLMRGAYEKVRDILQVLKDTGYNGCICMESNPTGPLLQVAKRIGIDPSILTSITPDMSRHKTLLLEKLSEKDPSLQYSDIDLTVIGEHGKEIPLLTEARIRDQPLIEVFPEFKKEEYRKNFVEEGRHIGLKLMTIADNLGDNYGGTPDEIVKQIENFAFLGRNISSAYSYFADADCFISSPSLINYPLRIESVSDTIEGLSQDKEVISELRKHIEYQKNLANEYLSKD